jgi:hypothetical protein
MPRSAAARFGERRCSWTCAAGRPPAVCFLWRRRLRAVVRPRRNTVANLGRTTGCTGEVTIIAPSRLAVRPRRGWHRTGNQRHPKGRRDENCPECQTHHDFLLILPPTPLSAVARCFSNLSSNKRFIGPVYAVKAQPLACVNGLALTRARRTGPSVLRTAAVSSRS